MGWGGERKVFRERWTCALGGEAEQCGDLAPGVLVGRLRPG